MTEGPFYDDIRVGDSLPSTTLRVTVPILQRWVASSETLRRDHYDAKFAIEHDGLPGAVLSGSFTQAYIWQLLFNWVGENGWVRKAQQRNARMIHPGTAITFFGDVMSKHEDDGLGYVELEIGLRRDDGEIAVPGTATVILPLRGGREIPYPFVA